MTEKIDLEYVEVYFSVGTHLGVPVTENGSVILPVDSVLEGERFSQRFVIQTDFGNESWKLVLSWSPSRAGDERISWGHLDGKPIDARKHPLYGTKNEQAGLYHETLPAGCYVCREESLMEDQ
jgi:hypothetical protein